MTALLEVAGVSKRFGGVQAVRGLNLAVHDGEILGLIGPNGAGKSTVFNLTASIRPIAAASHSRERTSPASRLTASPATVSPARIRSCSRSRT
jgi:ABC-type branched-subunit amino acid transport system ATPase component